MDKVISIAITAAQHAAIQSGSMSGGEMLSLLQNPCETVEWGNGSGVCHEERP